MTAPCLLHRHAQAQPDALALWAHERRWTYRELDAAVAATADSLWTEGVREETHVALRMPRGVDSVLLLWALWRTGAVAVPINTRLPAAEAWDAAKRARASLLVTREAGLLERETDGFDVISPERVVMRRGSEGPESVARPLRRPATVVFTSGSTGAPKAVVHTWANHVYSAKGSNANIRLQPGDRWALSLPLYHVGGLAILIRCALAGAAVAVPPPGASAPAVLDSTGSTHVSFVPTQLKRLLEASDGTPPPRIRALLLGGGPIPDSLLRRAHTRGWPLHTSYGSTEMASQVTTTPPGASLNDLRTAGRRLPHRRVWVDEAGDIRVAGKTLCAGILTEEGLRDPRVNGGYPTGDIGSFDASGRLRVEGRMDRQFVSGGENIQPREIEAALEQLEGVSRAVVVSVADDEYGRRPVGFVQTQTGHPPAQWQTALEAALPRYKIPDALYELPDAAVQGPLKVNHSVLRRRARQGRERRSGSS